MSGHSIKLQFHVFERSQVSHNGLDFYKNFGIYSINCKDYMLET